VRKFLGNRKINWQRDWEAPRRESPQVAKILNLKFSHSQDPKQIRSRNSRAAEKVLRGRAVFIPYGASQRAVV
jgi:hypothetical protein